MRLVANLALFGLFGIGFGIFLPGAIILAAVQSRLRTYAGQQFLKNRSTVIPEYEAPNNLSPSEASYLFYGHYTFDTERAILMELSASNSLELKIGVDSVTYQKVEPRPSNLERYKNNYLNKLSESGTIERGEFQPLTMSYLEAGIRPNLVQKSYLSGKKYPRRMIVIAAVISTILAGAMGVLQAYITLQPTSVTGISYSVNGQKVGHFSLASAIVFGFGMALFAVVFLFVQALLALVLYYRRLGIPADKTPKFDSTWLQLLGYRQYLQTAESDNMIAELNNGRMPDKNLLAYALGLGLINL